MMAGKSKAAGGIPEPRIGGRVKGRMPWPWPWHYLRGKKGKGAAWCRKSELFSFQLLYEASIMIMKQKTD